MVLFSGGEYRYRVRKDVNDTVNRSHPDLIHSIPDGSQFLLQYGHPARCREPTTLPKLSPTAPANWMITRNNVRTVGSIHFKLGSPFKRLLTFIEPYHTQTFTNLKGQSSIAGLIAYICLIFESYLFSFVSYLAFKTLSPCTQNLRTGGKAYLLPVRPDMKVRSISPLASRVIIG